MRINGHRKHLAYMSQPASGWYADCSCEKLRGALRGTKELSQADFDAHLEEVAKSLQKR